MSKICSIALVVLFAALASANPVKVYRQDFPYLVSLRTVGGQQRLNHFCEGTIISDQWILSAARCFNGNRLNVSNVVAAASDRNLRIDSETFALKQIVNHPRFSEEMTEYDISLLQTASVISFSRRVQPIAISNGWIGAANLVETAAWGMSESGSAPYILKTESLVTAPHDFCVESQDPEYQPFVHQSTLCAVFQHKKATVVRYGAGAPLISNKQLVGVFSWGIAKKPEQYTRVSEHIKWIKETSGVEAVDPEMPYY